MITSLDLSNNKKLTQDNISCVSFLLLYVETKSLNAIAEYKENIMKQFVSRRSFLKAACITAATMPLLTGCTPKEKSEKEILEDLQAEDSMKVQSNII